MTIVITMAGLGSRFKKAGYKIPKYEIDVNGKTLFEWSMMSLHGFDCKNYVFVVRKEDSAKSFIMSKCEKMNINGHIVEIEFLTKGQAETAMFAKPYWIENEPLLIYNIDTYVESGQMNDKQLKGDGVIPCFRGHGDHWSFARLDIDGKVVEVREKQRISDFCTVGAYYFKTAYLYEELYNTYYSNDEKFETGERYVAPLYNMLIKNGGNVYITDIPTDKVHVLGTPEEVTVFLKSDVAGKVM